MYHKALHCLTLLIASIVSSETIADATKFPLKKNKNVWAEFPFASIEHYDYEDDKH